MTKKRTFRDLQNVLDVAKTPENNLEISELMDELNNIAWSRRQTDPDHRFPSDADMTPVPDEVWEDFMARMEKIKATC